MTGGTEQLRGSLTLGTGSTYLATTGGNSGGQATTIQDQALSGFPKGLFNRDGVQVFSATVNITDSTNGSAGMGNDGVAYFDPTFNVGSQFRRGGTGTLTEVVQATGAYVFSWTGGFIGTYTWRTCPGPPAGITITVNAGQVMSGGYSAASDTGNSAIIDYRIQYRTASTSAEVSSATWGNETTSTSGSWSYSGLTAGNYYQFRVSARNAYGTGAATVSSITQLVAAGKITRNGTTWISTTTAQRYDATIGWTPISTAKRYNTAVISNVSYASNKVTYTSSGHPFVVGDVVTITGVTPTGYNLSNVTVTSISPTGTFTVAGTSAGTYVSGGLAGAWKTMS